MTSEEDDTKKEFQDFVYIVSHDFRAPVRHVKEFARLLSESLDREDQESVNIYKSYITQSADKLERMLDAMLIYSRINTQQKPFEPLNISDILSRVKARLQGEYEGVEEAVQIGNIENFSADPDQIENLFYYLLDNALKFNDKAKNKKVVMVNGVVKGNSVVYTVEDNGIGIPEISQEQIFTMYRQLKPNQDGKSVGAGLTLAKK